MHACTSSRGLAGGFVLARRRRARESDRCVAMAEDRFNPYSVWIFPMIGFREGLTLKVDADNREIIVDLNDRILDKDRKKDKDGKSDQETGSTSARPRSPRDRRRAPRQALPRGGHLLPEGLLVTRGFRWINEAPFNGSYADSRPWPIRATRS